MGVRIKLKEYIFVTQHDTDIIQVSLYSLNGQLSFNTPILGVYSMQKWSNARNSAFLIIKVDSTGQKVKSEVAPYLKVTFIVYANYASSFILLSQNAHRKCLVALLNRELKDWIEDEDNFIQEIE